MSAPNRLHSLPENRLLAGLPREDHVRLLPHLHAVTLVAGHVLHKEDDSSHAAYFPGTAVVSLFHAPTTGATGQVGLIGHDGMVGLGLFLSGRALPCRAVVKVGGSAVKLDARPLRHEFERGGALARRLLRYTQAFIVQLSQTAVCNAAHPVLPRLCRLLLSCHDHLKAADLQLTQEALAQMVGARRESVALAAHRLQEAGLIRYARGHIRILDRKGLERAACECHRALEIELARLRD